MLAALLLASAATFAIGVAVERSQSERHQEAGVGGGIESEGEAHEEGGLSEEHAREGGGGEQEELFGVDTESVPLVTAFVVLSAALAVGVVAVRPPAFLLLVAVIAFLATAFDIREAVHQADESRMAVLTLAAVTAGLHVIVGLLSAPIAASEARAASRSAEAR